MTVPKKELGQHWLRDEVILSNIAQLAELSATDTVLEVGPGLGTLTGHLAKAANKVVAVEFDEDLVSHLQKIDLQNVEVVHDDIRKFNLKILPKNYKLVANIPYYLTSYLLQQISETDNPPTLAILLVQKEVAERVAASPGAMSVLSVAVQYYFEVERGPVVPAKLFDPPPKVDSQALILRRRPEPLFGQNDSKSYFRIVKAGFSQKRKTMENALSAGLQIDKPAAAQLLLQAGIEPGARAQKLSLYDWQQVRLKAQASGYA